MEEIDILHIFSLEHLFYSYYKHDELNLKINKLLKIKEEEKDYFGANPEEYKYIRSLIDYPVSEEFEFLLIKIKFKL